MIAGAVLLAAAATVAAAPLVILEETGTEQDGLPVFRLAPGSERLAHDLSRGLCGRILRLYALEQAYLGRTEGTRPEPAYLLLSTRQGGFPRKGFVLHGTEKRHAGYVDLHRGWPAGGRFGAMDQIFPHELMHVMLEQLTGPPGEGGANQVHAVGVRTDRFVAFNEGLAEHLQAMAIDDPDALPATRALARDGDAHARVFEHLRQYRRQMEARFALAPRMRLGFPLWWSGGEAVLRYVAVKDNAFAREVDLPEHLLGPDPFRAYLLASTLPGEPGAPPRSLARALATEGVVASFFYRFAADDVLRHAYREEAFYGRLGVARADVPPELNVYLKLLHVLHAQKPKDAAGTIRAYVATFPDEAARVEDLSAQVFGVRRLEPPPEIWMANRAFTTGTTIFDQFRGLPRVHTFDLNAASLVDLVGVEGVDLPLARAILEATPVDGVEALAAVPGVTPELLQRLRGLAAEMDPLKAALREEAEDSLSFSAILMPAVWRALGVIVLGGVLGAAIHRLVRGKCSSPWRSPLAGLTASLLGTTAGWIVGPGVVVTLLVGILLGAAPALVAAWRRRGVAQALRVLAAWIGATAPGMALITPWL